MINFRIISITIVFIYLTASFTGCGNNKSEVLKNPDNASNHEKDQYRLKHYIIEGRKLYEKHCSNCHQQDGSGLARLIPPLKDADFLVENKHRLLCIIKFGIHGEIYVNDQDFNQPMPGIPELTNLELAEIATFVLNNFTNDTHFIAVRDVPKLLATCNSDNINNAQ